MVKIMNAQERINNEFDAFKALDSADRIPEVETYVLKDVGPDGIVLVKLNTHYNLDVGDYPTLESVVFPHIDKGDVNSLLVQDSHKGSDFFDHLIFGIKGKVYKSFTDNPAWENARYGIIPLGDDSIDLPETYKVLRDAGVVQRLYPDQIEEGKAIYNTLFDGNFNTFSLRNISGVKPEQVETDVLDNSITINAAGDIGVGWVTGESQQTIRDFLFQFHSLDKMRLDLRGTSVKSGTYKGQFNTDIEQTLSNINNWIPDALKYKLFENFYINVTDSKVGQEDGLTVFENGKARKPKPEECWPVVEA